jgi:hypothetical protein
MGAPLVVRVDNATPIILNREKSVTPGILGMLALWRATFLSPSIDVFQKPVLCIGRGKIGLFV